MSVVNTFTKIPNTGDAVVGLLATHEVKFITADTFDNTELSADYERIGVVVSRKGNVVKIAYKENASKVWCKRYDWTLTGYTLDGTTRTGVISIRVARNSWASNVAKTITYNASSLQEFVNALNFIFTTDTDFIAQDWYARIEGNAVKVQCDFISWQQASYNSASAGFSWSASTLPDVVSLANIRRKHGGNGGEGAISSMERALAYFANDNSSTNYNPASEVTSVKTTYPICKPAYLGTSTYQSDHCALLRATYGEGEEGWKKYMRSCLPVIPTDYGNMGQKDGLARTMVLAGKTYTSATKTNEIMCPSAKYCADIATDAIPQGNWFLGTTEVIADLLSTIKHGTDGSRNADPINKTLNAMGGTAISNGSYLWSCCRCNSNLAWYAYGANGLFCGYHFCYAYQSLPLALFKI